MRTKVDYRSTSKEVFKNFKLKHPEVNLNYLEWCNILYSFNSGFRDLCLETGFRLKFPYGLGEFCITKWKPKKKKILDSGLEVINLPVDWKKTKQMGKKIYHMNFDTGGYKFRWLWVQSSARFYFSSVWNCKPSRVSSRLITHYLKQKYDSKYLEWK